MKLKVDTKSFVDSIAWATKNFDAKNEKSYVELNIDEDNGEYYLAHSNINSYMKQNFTVIESKFKDSEPTVTSLAMDGKYLSRLAGAIPATGEIILSKDLESKQTSLLIKAAIGSFTVPLFTTTPADEPEYVFLGDVNDNEFFLSLSKISKVSDTKNSGSQSFVGAIDISFKNLDKEGESRINLFATDRYAMSEISMSFDPNEITDEDDKAIADRIFEKNFLLPATYASIISPTKGLVTDITLIAEENNYGSLRFGYAFPDGRIALFSLLDVATFPSIEALKTKSLSSVDSSVVLSRSEVENAIRTVSSLAWDDDDVFFTITSDSFVISDRADKNKLSLEISEIKLPEEIDDENAIRFRFVRTVINAALSPITTGKIKFGWGESKSLFTLGAVTEDDQLLDNVFSIAAVGKN